MQKRCFFGIVIPRAAAKQYRSPCDCLAARGICCFGKVSNSRSPGVQTQDRSRPELERLAPRDDKAEKNSISHGVRPTATAKML